MKQPRPVTRSRHTPPPREHLSQVLRALRDGDALTPVDVTARTALSPKEVRRSLLHLASEGRLERVTLPDGVLYALPLPSPPPAPEPEPVVIVCPPPSSHT